VVKATGAGERWREVWCSALPGFHLLVSPKGRKVFAVRYRTAGGYRRERLGPVEALSLEDARSLARQRLGDVCKGRDPAGEKRAQRAREKARREADSISDLADKWLADRHGGHKKRERQESTIDAYRRLLDQHVLPAFGKRRVDDPITPEEIEDWHRKIGATTPGRANRALSCMSALLSYAAKRRLRPRGANPCANIDAFEGKSPGRFMTPDERERLETALAAAERIELGHAGYLGAGAILAFRLMTRTGMRAGEVVALEWRDVDLARGVVHLRVSKTGPRTFALGPSTRAMLQRIRDANPTVEIVCASEVGTALRNLRRAWGIVRTRAKLGTLRMHDLRHAYVSSAVAAGVPLAVVGESIGHRNITTTLLYMHLRSAELSKAAELAEAAIVGESEGCQVIELRRTGSGLRD
jgi:integrase